MVSKSNYVIRLKNGAITYAGVRIRISGMENLGIPECRALSVGLPTVEL